MAKGDYKETILAGASAHHVWRAMFWPNTSLKSYENTLTVQQSCLVRILDRRLAEQHQSPPISSLELQKWKAIWTVW